MATILNLKKRKSGDTAVLSIDQFRPMLNLPESEAKDQLYALFQNLVDIDQYVHDKHWLEQIVNFIALDNEGNAKRIPFTEQAKWLKLAEKVGELDIKKEGGFTLTAYQETIIWERFNSDDFTMRGMPQAFVGFVLDFLDVTGRRFADMEPEKDEEKSESDKKKK